MRSFAAAASFPDIANIVLAATISGVSELTTMIAMLLHVLMPTGCNCRSSVYGRLFAASDPQLGAVAPIAGSYIFLRSGQTLRWRFADGEQATKPVRTIRYQMAERG
jgi:hypothetical protein